MQGEKHVGSIWNVQLNAKAIMDSGIKLNSDEWILFTTIHSMFGTTWAKKIPVGDQSYVLVSNKFIKQQLVAFPDLANISDVTLWRKVKKLEDVGLLVRHDKNSEKAKCYMGLGENSDFFSNQPISKMKDPLSELKGEPLSELKDYNSTKDNSIKENMPPTPSAEVPSETSTAPSQDSEKTRAPRVKKRITYKEAKEFYDGQLKDLFPLPESVAPGGDEWKRREGYRRMIEWMTKGDDETPETMQSTVMAMPSQLTYVQLCKLLERNLTWYQIKHYIKRLHGYTELKSRGVYDTIVNWHNGDVAKNAVPPANPGKTPTGDASMKATKPTNQTYNH